MESCRHISKRAIWILQRKCHQWRWGAKPAQRPGTGHAHPSPPHALRCPLSQSSHCRGVLGVFCALLAPSGWDPGLNLPYFYSTEDSVV